MSRTLVSVSRPDSTSTTFLMSGKSSSKCAKKSCDDDDTPLLPPPLFFLFIYALERRYQKIRPQGCWHCQGIRLRELCAQCLQPMKYPTVQHIVETMENATGKKFNEIAQEKPPSIPGRGPPPPGWSCFVKSFNCCDTHFVHFQHSLRFSCLRTISTFFLFLLPQDAAVVLPLLLAALVVPLPLPSMPQYLIRSLINVMVCVDGFGQIQPYSHCYVLHQSNRQRRLTIQARWSPPSPRSRWCSSSSRYAFFPFQPLPNHSLLTITGRGGAPPPPGTV